MTYIAAEDRYEKMPYRRCGRSGIDLPEVSLGLWQKQHRQRRLRALIRGEPHEPEPALTSGTTAPPRSSGPFCAAPSTSA